MLSVSLFACMSVYLSVCMDVWVCSAVSLFVSQSFLFVFHPGFISIDRAVCAKSKHKTRFIADVPQLFCLLITGNGDNEDNGDNYTRKSLDGNVDCCSSVPYYTVVCVPSSCWARSYPQALQLTMVLSLERLELGRKKQKNVRLAATR